MDQGHNNNGDDKEDQQDLPVENTDENQSEASVKTTHGDEVHKTDILIVSDCVAVNFWFQLILQFN